jgi:hypothetical protein
MWALLFEKRENTYQKAVIYIKNMRSHMPMWARFRLKIGKFTIIW